MPSRIFISHLHGGAVFDQDGDQVGRVRDVVVSLRVETTPPRVLGLVVEIQGQGRRRIFLPMTKVVAIDAGTGGRSRVICSGLLNMRRFQPRPMETLVLSELLDRRVTLVPSEEPVTVRDVAMHEVAGGDWEIDKVYVQRPGKGIRRRGEELTVPWTEVSGLAPAEETQGADSLLATFDNMRPADLAHAIHDLTPKRRTEVASALGDERLADVLQELPEDHQVEILAKLDVERAADILEAMEPDDAADLLSELPAEDAERLLELMEPDEAAPVRRLLTYPDDVAGGIMTSEPVVLPPDGTVAEALARIRNPDLTPALASQIYVCRPPSETPTGTYLGTVHFQRLLREPPSTIVGALIDNTITPLRPDAELAVVTGYLATYNLVAAPIVDDTDHLLGTATVDDVLDHLLPDDWRHRAHDDDQPDQETSARVPDQPEQEERDG